MTRNLFFGLSLALLALGQPLSADKGKDKSEQPRTETAPRFAADLLVGVQLLQSGKPQEAEKIFSEIIAGYEKQYGDKVIFRCANSPENTLAALIGAAAVAEKRKVVVGNEEWCTALWGKGFALIDLNRAAEAGPFLAKAVEMDPGNAHFINEYAEWYKSQRQFKRSHELFAQAWDTVDHDKQGPDRRVAARSLRGIAYNLIEEGDLDGAEKLYRQSLEYEPEAASGKVQPELDYIAEQRDKAKKLS